MISLYSHKERLETDLLRFVRIAITVVLCVLCGCGAYFGSTAIRSIVGNPPGTVRAGATTAKATDVVATVARNGIGRDITVAEVNARLGGATEGDGCEVPSPASVMFYIRLEAMHDICGPFSYDDIDGLSRQLFGASLSELREREGVDWDMTYRALETALGVARTQASLVGSERPTTLAYPDVDDGDSAGYYYAYLWQLGALDESGKPLPLFSEIADGVGDGVATEDAARRACDIATAAAQEWDAAAEAAWSDEFSSRVGNLSYVVYCL